MPVLVVLGAQWGDEGKGKVVDLLAADADIVARFQGGPNAGHTVVIGEEQYILHQIPSGILHPGKQCLIGNGVVIDPVVLLEEIDDITRRGVAVMDNLLISDRAHLIMPYHRAIDQESERLRSAGKIGTTGRGIGLSYADKMSRTGLRVVDLLDEKRFREKLAWNVREKNTLLASLYQAPPVQEEELFRLCMEFRDRVRGNIVDTRCVLAEAAKAGKRVLCEGAQGTLLDIDWGTYPFVTSSSTVAAGACTGLGLPPGRIDFVLGVAKAYTTRVGGGPLPTELEGERGDALREKGQEYGATTGRPRRCGWFDAVAVRHAVALSGIDRLAITKLDVLDEQEKLFVCVAYKHGSEVLRDMPADVALLGECEPQFVELEGWMTSTAAARSWEELPKKAGEYLRFLEECVEAKVSVVSIGPQRRRSIVTEQVWDLAGKS
jgi:adenylosuccinate synthase